jgi:chromosome segregation ATPase
MRKLPPTLLALSLALALAVTPAYAQQVTTSHGVRTLQRTDAMKTEMELRQALASGEQVLAEVMLDYEAAEKAYSSVSGSAAEFPEKIKGAQADFARAQESFNQSDQQYREQVAAYERRRAELDEDIARQRAAAAPLEALPSAQRDINEVFRLNEWSTKIGKEREAINAEGDRLLTEHDRVEGERAKLELQRKAVDAALQQKRTALVGDASNAQNARKLSFDALRVTVGYVEKVRTRLNAITANKAPRSQLLDRAMAKLHEPVR